MLGMQFISFLSCQGKTKFFPNIISVSKNVKIVFYMFQHRDIGIHWSEKSQKDETLDIDVCPFFASLQLLLEGGGKMR